MSYDVALFGAGAWGTALAVHLAQRMRVALWARDAAHAALVAEARENARYLPGISLPASLAVTADLAEAAQAATAIVATPVAALVEVVERLGAAGARAPLAWLSKGFVEAPELAAGVGLAHQVLAPRWPAPVGVVSGPSFAEEVAHGLPTALVVAATDAGFARALAGQLRDTALRAYDSADLAGVEAGGAIKNVLAIAAGACDGLGFGQNARAALITRGLAEATRLAAAMGGDPRTLMGLAGLGDLVLTCTGDLSRNRRVGLSLARGESLPAILASIGHVAEGVHAARAARRLALHHGVDMPIVEAVYRVLYEELPPRRAVEALLAREPKSETG
ncbi:MAG TPA: NAD(P)H-dependent glycerol-3-phosphate dehydrogenase [Casimicrobiaceae bacterium]|nr:NAD(P)H-dependent glycerol-3-phosphate dehydrogenase [Casimicrobiaceae bacterium]